MFPIINPVAPLKANVLKLNGEHEEGLAMYKSTLATQERMLGIEHPNTKFTAQQMDVRRSRF
jgi:hypothetical protein